MAERTVSIQRNAIYNTIKSVLTIIYPLITFPYISRVLGAENVGKINFGSSVVSYFSLVASLGVTTYAIRECSKVRDDKDELSRTASQILSINIFSTLIAYIALAITFVMARSLDSYRVLICIQSTTIILGTLGADWLNSAMEDFRYITYRTIGFQILALVLMFAFVRKPEHYMIYAVISVIASSGFNVLNVFYRRRYCHTGFTLNLDLKRHLPPILLLFSMMLTQQIYVNSDITMLGLMKGDVEVGLYSTAVNIYKIVNSIVASVAYVVMPQLASNFARENYDEINRLLKYALNFIIVLGLPCIAGMNVIATEIVYVVAGEEYIEAASPLHILTVALLLSFIGGWMSNMTLLPAGRERVCLSSGIISAIVNIVLNFILIPYFGQNAAAFTTALAELVGLIYISAHLDRRIHVNGLRNMLVGPILGSAGIIIVGIIVKATVRSYYMIVLITVLVSTVVYCMALLLTRNEFFIGMVRPVILRFKRKA